MPPACLLPPPMLHLPAACASGEPVLAPPAPGRASRASAASTALIGTTRDIGTSGDSKGGAAGFAPPFNPSASRTAPLGSPTVLEVTRVRGARNLSVRRFALPAAVAAALILPPPAAAKQLPPPIVPAPINAPDPATTPPGSPFEGDGMWIWYASRSSGGSPDAIAGRAAASGIETVFLKSSDGPNYWSQFNLAYVNALKARGLRVCAWQYVYGRQPTTEAKLGARAIRNGADCLVIDAEIEYEGKYAQASTYITKLRAYAGDDYPIGLAGWPYVDYHPGYPFSVFFGPGGAQFNV